MIEHPCFTWYTGCLQVAEEDESALARNTLQKGMNGTPSLRGESGHRLSDDSINPGPGEQHHMSSAEATFLSPNILTLAFSPGCEMTSSTLCVKFESR